MLKNITAFYDTMTVSVDERRVVNVKKAFEAISHDILTSSQDVMVWMGGQLDC